MDLFGVKAQAAATVAQATGGLLESVGKTAKDIRAAVTGKSVIDEEAQAKLELSMAELEGKIQESQAKINEIEAASTSFFVSGWRPAIGWICASAIGMNFLIFPILKLIPKFVVPAIDTEQLWPLVLGMLGLGTMRTAEKFKDKARS